MLPGANELKVIPFDHTYQCCRIFHEKYKNYAVNELTHRGLLMAKNFFNFNNRYHILNEVTGKEFMKKKKNTLGE